MSSLRARIRIDRELCEGSGSCAFQAPSTFDIDDDTKVILVEGIDSDQAIRAAVESCPTHAIAIADEPPSEDSDATG
jgi:ferredoxin